MLVERSLIIIKPDAVIRNISGDIIKRFEDQGFKIIAQKILRLTENQVKNFYYIHKNKPFFMDLCSFMISGPVIVQVLEGKNVVQLSRKLIGATDPAISKKGTIRKDFAESKERNSIHGSDSVDNALFEVSFFF